jgi:hypothetical protein
MWESKSGIIIPDLEKSSQIDLAGENWSRKLTNPPSYVINWENSPGFFNLFLLLLE